MTIVAEGAQSGRTAPSHAHGKRLGAGLVGVGGGAGAPAFEAALQQAHQAGVPVADDEQNQERSSEVILVRERIENGRKEVRAEEQLDPWGQHEALAVLGGLRLFTLLGDAVLG